MKIKIFKDIANIVQIQNMWQMICNTNDLLDVFQSVEWVLAWYKCFNSHRNACCCVAVYDDNDNLNAILPLAKNPHTNSLELAGDPLNDYNNIIMRKDINVEKMFTEVIFSIRNNFDTIKCFNINCINPLTSCFLDINFVRIGCNVIKCPDDTCVLLELPATNEEYANTISTNNLKKFSYYKRRIFKLDNIKFHKLESSDNVKSFFEWFKKSKVDYWQRTNQLHLIPYEVKSNKFFEFLLNLFIELSKCNRIIIPYIKHNENIVSSGIYFISNTKIMKYIQSWDYSYKKYNPGTVLDWLMIRYAIDNKFKIFDFGRGNEKYKYNFGGKNRYLFKLKIELK